MTTFPINYYHTYKRGMTLLEVLIALTLLTIAVVGFFKMSHMSVKTAETSFDRTTAISLAEEKINNLRLPPDSMAVQPLSTEKLTKNNITYTIKSIITEKKIPLEVKSKTGEILKDADPKAPELYFVDGFQVAVTVEWGTPSLREDLTEFIPNPKFKYTENL